MAASSRIILDSGALTALADFNEAIRSYLLRELRAGADILIPAVVLVESVTGTNLDANLNRLARPYSVRVIDEQIARAAGQLRHACRRRGAGTIDAIVVAIADAVANSFVVTTDPDDIRHLAAQRGTSRIIAM